MNEYLDVLARCPLFRGSDGSEIHEMLKCLGAKRRSYAPHATIFEAGSDAFALGVVVSGAVDIVQEDFWGNQRLMARLSPGHIFAESFVLAQMPRLPVGVLARQASVVLLLDYERILHTCSNACPHHARMISNLLHITAQKNVYLTQKMEIVTKKTIKEKLLAFLAFEAQRAGGNRFTIPYDRQALADYLAVDRSALSRTLGEMQKEGLLSVSRSVFEIRRP